MAAEGFVTMSVSALDMSSNNTDENVDTVVEFFHHLKAERFLRLGLSSVVYFRACTMEGGLAYAIHSADGALIAVAEDIGTAVAKASGHGMAIVTVH